jgi:hypothetical protein
MQCCCARRGAIGEGWSWKISLPLPLPLPPPHTHSHPCSPFPAKRGCTTCVCRAPALACAAVLSRAVWGCVCVYAQAREHGKLWLIVDGFVVDVALFADEHPGGKALLTTERGNDVTDKVKGASYRVRAHSLGHTLVTPLHCVPPCCTCSFRTLCTLCRSYSCTPIWGCGRVSCALRLVCFTCG